MSGSPMMTSMGEARAEPIRARITGIMPRSVRGPSRRRCFEGPLDEGVDHPLLEGTDFCGR